MKLLTLLLLIQPCYAQLVIANAANGSTTNFAPGSLILVASQSAPTLTIAPSTPVPVLTAVSQGIFLAQLPSNLPLGPATLNGASITIVPTSFGIFTGPISAGVAVYVSGLVSLTSIIVQPGLHFAQKNNGPQVGLVQPAHPGDYLTIYGTGLGNATPDQISVSLAGLPIPVTYAGPAPGQSGVDQINVSIPPSLQAPDSCYDSFAITVAGVPITPQPLSYTQAAATCPSPFGYNASELAKIDSGTQVPFVRLSLGSTIYSAASADNVGTGFTREESALVLQFSSPFPAPLNYADSAFYSCAASQQGGGIAIGAFVLGYKGLSLGMGSATVPFGSNIPLPQAVPTPGDLPPSIFQPGLWQLTAPNFSQPLQIAPPIELNNFASLQFIDSTQDLTLAWNPAGYAASDVLTVSLQAPPSPFFTSSGVICTAHATAGSLTIPSVLLKSIPTSENLTAQVFAHPDQTPNFRLPQSDGSTLPLQFTYNFSETFPVTLH